MDPITLYRLAQLRQQDLLEQAENPGRTWELLRQLGIVLVNLLRKLVGLAGRLAPEKASQRRAQWHKSKAR
jgi:hypothetical protein